MDVDDVRAQGIAGPVLKDSRAYWLYQIPIIALAALPLLVVVGLVVMSWVGVSVESEVITIMGTLAATALGGLVNMITAGGGQRQG